MRQTNPAATPNDDHLAKVRSRSPKTCCQACMPDICYFAITRYRPFTYESLNYIVNRARRMAVQLLADWYRTAHLTKPSPADPSCAPRARPGQRRRVRRGSCRARGPRHRAHRSSSSSFLPARETAVARTCKAPARYCHHRPVRVALEAGPSADPTRRAESQRAAAHARAGW